MADVQLVEIRFTRDWHGYKIGHITIVTEDVGERYELGKVATIVRRIQPRTRKSLDEMTKGELLELAERRGVELPKRATTEQIRSLLRGGRDGTGQ